MTLLRTNRSDCTEDIRMLNHTPRQVYMIPVSNLLISYRILSTSFSNATPYHSHLASCCIKSHTDVGRVLRTQPSLASRAEGQLFPVCVHCLEVYKKKIGALPFFREHTCGQYDAI